MEEKTVSMASLNLPVMDLAVHDQDTGNGMDSPPIGFSRPHVNVPASHVSSGGDASIRALTSFLPKISKSFNEGDMDLNSPFFYMCADNEKVSAVDQWKKLARKTEIELHLEKDLHQSNRAQDCQTIERLQRRTEVLEAATQERDATIDNQRKKIKQLRSNLECAGKLGQNFDKEKGKLQGQAIQIQQKFSTAAVENEKKVRELKQELEAANKKTELLRNQIEEICLYMEASPESMFTGTDPSRDISRDESANGQDYYVSPQKESQRKYSSPGDSSPGQIEDSEGLEMRRRSTKVRRQSESYPDMGIAADEAVKNPPPHWQFGGSSFQFESSALAMRVLAIRNQNVQLTQLLRERDERIRHLVQEAEAAKKGAQDVAQSKEELGGFLHMVVADRDAALFKLKEMEDALSQLQSVERELSRLAARPWPEPKEMLGGLLVYNPSKYAVKWQFKSPQQLAEEDPKHLYLLKKRSSNPALHENAGRSNPVKTGSPVKERKESRKNYGLLFHKIFDAIQTIVSKATAANQVATNMKVEKEFVAGAVVEIKKELLGPPHRVEEKKNVPGKRNLGEPVKRLDKEEAGKLLAAVKDLKVRTEAQKKDKANLEAYIAEREATIADLQATVIEMKNQTTNLVHTQKAISNSLGVTDQTGLNSREGSLHDIQEKQETSPIVQRILALTKERDESKALLAETQHELEKTQRSFNDLKTTLAETRSSISDFGRQKDALEGRNRELQTRLSEIQGTAAAVMKEKEILDRQCHDLQRTLSESNSSIVVMGMEKDTTHRRNVELQTLLFDAKNAHSHVPEQRRPFDIKHISMTAEGILREKDMVQRQLLGMQEFVTAMDTVLGLGDAVLSDNLKIALRRECGGQERLLEKLMLQREELEAWREEVRRERDLTAAAIQDMNDVLSGLDHFAIRNRHPANTRLIARVRTVIERKEQLEQVIDQSQALDPLLLPSIQALRDLVPNTYTRVQLETSFIQKYPLVSADLLRAAWELPELVKLVADLRTEKGRVEIQLKAMEAERDDLQKRHDMVRHEVTQEFVGTQQEAQELKEHLDAAHSLIYAPPTTNPEEILKQRRISLSGNDDSEMPAHPVVKGIARMKRESVLLIAKNATEERKVQDLHRQITTLAEKNEDLISQLKAAEAKIHDLSEQVTTVESWAHDFSKQATTVDSKVQDMARQIELAEYELEKLYSLVLSEMDPNSLELYKAGRPNLASSGRFLSEQIKEVYTKAKETFKAREVEIARLQEGSENLGRRLGEQEGGVDQLIAKVDLLMKEVRRLGGYNIFDEKERQKREAAAQKVHEFLSAVPDGPGTRRISFHRVGQVKANVTASPLLKLATFQVDLLVNSKVHQALEVGGNLGGICQAAVHYFQVNEQRGDITFENTTLPGSQSSNMLIDVMLLPVDVKKSYETNAGDILGLHIRARSLFHLPLDRLICVVPDAVRASADVLASAIVINKTGHGVAQSHEQQAREVLYNNSIIHTNEVLEAIQGQPIDSFSLWPDLVSSWRWERTSQNSWSLVCVRWRFLFKNIIPELSEAFQTLSINNSQQLQGSFQRHNERLESRTNAGP